MAPTNDNAEQYVIKMKSEHSPMIKCAAANFLITTVNSDPLVLALAVVEGERPQHSLLLSLV